MIDGQLKYSHIIYCNNIKQDNVFKKKKINYT